MPSKAESIYECDVPGCASREVLSGGFGFMSSAPDDWDLVFGLWICPNHEILLQTEAGPIPGIQRAKARNAERRRQWFR